MNQIDLTFAIHSHQPVGNFDHVIENNYRESYEPFLCALEKHPGISTALHYTGYLWDYIKSEHPDFIERLHELVEKNQVEMLGGAYYEAILTVLPERDAVSQQKIMKSEMIRFSSGIDVAGMWLAERIWEPGMPSVLHKGGYRYTFLDESHFHAAGVKSEDIHGTFRTEDKGCDTIIFPIDKQLRYSIPFKPPEKSGEYLQAMIEAGRKLVTYGDDGEKFGSWPGTFEWVYKKGWLEKSFTMLENDKSVNIILPREAVQNHSPRGDVYLPCASYEEMGEWTLPAETQVDLHHLKDELKEAGLIDRVSPYIRGGFWRQFFAKYPESAKIYRRMLRVSDKVSSLCRKRNQDDDSTGKAIISLLKGQANDAYWHGVFGGVYLPHLRSAVQKELIVAETICDRQLSPNKIPADKYEPDAEVLSNSKLRVQFSCDHGGGISSLDVREAGIDLVNTMSRYREPYHTRLLEAKDSGNKDENATIHDRIAFKEADMEKKLAVDTYRRYCFIDRFLPADFNFEDLQYNRGVELGDFTDGKYGCRKLPDGISLFCNGSIESKFLALKKVFIMSENGCSLKADYTFTAKDKDFPDIYFAPELNLNLLAPEAEDRFFLINGEPFEHNNLGSSGERSGIRQFSLVDEWQGIRIDIETSPQARWVWHPVETISLSEEGIERIYQGSAILPLFDLNQLIDSRISVTLTIDYWKPII